MYWEIKIDIFHKTMIYMYIILKVISLVLVIIYSDTLVTACVSTFTAVQYMPRLETIEYCMKLSQMLIQAVDVRSSPLLQLPHITQDMLKHFTTKKVGLNTSPIKRYTFKNTSPQKKVHACLNTK